MARRRVMHYRSLGVRLLVIVNSVCLILVVLFLAYDYRQELNRRLSDKRIALHEEAIAMQLAVRKIRHQGIDALRNYIDSVCAGMEETHSPGHFIAVRLDETVLQTSVPRQADGDLLRTLEAAAEAAEREGRFQDREFIVGRSHEHDLAVYVAEYVDTIHRQVTQDSLRRLGGIVTLAVIAAVVVNMILVRIVIRPLERLVGMVEQIGIGNFGQQLNGFRSFELSYLSDAINRMSASLADADWERRSEMDKARQIQQNLLPPESDVIGASMAVHYKPAEDVAGDFYDVRSLPDRSWLICLADVTGHGIPAAMSATLLKAFVSEACEQFTDPLEILTKVNQRFTAMTLRGDFATSLLVRFRPQTCTLEFVNAGHNSGLYCSHDGTLLELKSSGLPIGIEETATWNVDEIAIQRGDRLLMFTDGVTETFNPRQEMFGRQRVRELFCASIGTEPASTLERLETDLANFRAGVPQLDDVTVVLLEF